MRIGGDPVKSSLVSRTHSQWAEDYYSDYWDSNNSVNYLKYNCFTNSSQITSNCTGFSSVTAESSACDP